MTQSARAGLTFPVGRIGRYMREKLSHKMRCAKHAPVFAAAVLEYLCAEVLDMTGNICL